MYFPDKAIHFVFLAFAFFSCFSWCIHLITLSPAMYDEDASDVAMDGEDGEPTSDECSGDPSIRSKRGERNVGKVIGECG